MFYNTGQLPYGLGLTLSWMFRRRLPFFNIEQKQFFVVQFKYFIIKKEEEYFMALSKCQNSL